MTKDEAMKLALEAMLKWSWPLNSQELEAITALRQALEQPEVWKQKHWTEYERSIAAAENEACARVAETECCKCADAAAAIRARMK